MIVPNIISKYRALRPSSMNSACKLLRNNKYYKSNETQLYRPYQPLYPGKNRLFISNQWYRGITLQRPLWLKFQLPSILILLNNMLTEWNIYNSIGLVISLISFELLRFNAFKDLSRNIYSLSIQVNDNKIQFFHILAQRTHFTMLVGQQNEITQMDIPQHFNYLSEQNQISQSELARIINPDTGKPLFPNTDKTSVSYQRVIELESKRVWQYAHRLISIRIPASKITKFIFTQENHIVIEIFKDKESVQQLMKKMQDKKLFIYFPFEKYKQTVQQHFIVDLSNNADMKYHDVLVACGLNIPISLT